MADHIRIHRAEGTWVVRAAGAVLGESSAALELTEGAMTPVIYFPRADLAMAMLEPSPTVSTCPHKGAARYFSIVTEGAVLRDAAWSYETPHPGLEAIAGHVAFYGNGGDIAVEQV